MITKVTGILLLGALALPAYATDIYRWTDETGRVNYGNSVPQRYKQVARKIDTSAAQVSVTDAQRRADTARSQDGSASAGASAGGSASTGSGTPSPVGPGGVGY